MVDVTKPIVNPRLSEALAALHRENTPANQDRALRELMTQAHLLAPVVLTPAPSPAVSGQTTLEQNTAIQFQLISSQEGRPFFPAFTNWGELRKLCGPRDQQTLVLTFDDYASMLQRDSRAAGFVVDPFGDSLTLDRETVARLARQRALHRSGRRFRRIPESCWGTRRSTRSGWWRPSAPLPVSSQL